MGSVFIIGTLHCGLTPKKELEKLFIKYKPNQIFVEVLQGDLNEKNIRNYPPEMTFAFKWAKKKKIKVNGFDSKINCYKQGFRDVENKLIKQQKKIMKNFNWKDMNKEKNLRLLDTNLEKEFLNFGKLTKRHKEMLKNLKKQMLKESTILILTGCSHLSFFERHLKNAVFPFR